MNSEAISSIKNIGESSYLPPADYFKLLQKPSAQPWTNGVEEGRENVQAERLQFVHTH